jgi:hypothetical protein
VASVPAVSIQDAVFTRGLTKQRRYADVGMHALEAETFQGMTWSSVEMFIGHWTA